MNVVDRMREERPRYDPNSVLAGDDGLDEMPDYSVDHCANVEPRSDPQVVFISSRICSNRLHQLSVNFICIN